MYYRRKLLLAIVEKSTSQKINTVHLHHVLFLMSQQQSTPYFNFVPHTNGCVSFQADRDLDVLSRYYKLIDHTDNHWVLAHNQEPFYNTLTHTDQHICDTVLQQFNTEGADIFMQKVYDISPYHAIRASDGTLNLTPPQQKKKQQERAKIKNATSTLFSIGYEGVSIDAYLNTLIRQAIKLLCDVRKNAHSMKYGFSKKTLEGYCGTVGIEYVHIPSLGIASEKRKNLSKAADYQKIFKEYDDHIHKKEAGLMQIQASLKKYNRVALTCFESDHEYCHRHILMQHYVSNVGKIKSQHL